MTDSGNVSTETSRSVPFRVSGSVATGAVLQGVNSSMIAIAIVAITAQFGAATEISWVISAFYIATAVTAPTAGRLGALLGSRRIYMYGLSFVAIGSIVGMFAPNIGWLIAAYSLIGIGTATQFPTAMIMIREYADHFKQQPQSAITTLAICGQVVVALGPTVGGLLVGAFGWQAILWINLPAVALSAALVWFFVDARLVGRSPTPSRKKQLQSLDLGGVALLLALISTTMVFLLSLKTDPLWSLLGLWSLILATFIYRECRAVEPFLDVRALARNRALNATLGRTLLTYTAFYCIYFGIPQWLQYARGMDPIQAGLTMLPVAAVGIGSTVVASRIYKRFGARLTLAIGTCALLIGGLLLAAVESSTAPIVVVLLVAGVLGIPNGFNSIGNQNLINSVSSVTEVGTAIGMFKTFQFIGANLSAAVLQVLAGPVITDAGIQRTGWFIAAAGAILLIGVLLSRNMGSRPTSRRKDRVVLRATAA